MSLQGLRTVIFTKRGTASELCRELFENWSPSVFSQHKKLAKMLTNELDDVNAVLLPLDARELVAYGMDVLWEVKDIQEYNLPNIGQVRLVSFWDGYTHTQRYLVLESLTSSEIFAVFVGNAQFEVSTDNYRKLLQHIDYAPLTNAQLTARAKAIGIAVKFNSEFDEYRITPIAGDASDREDVASYTSDRDDAWGTALQMSMKIKEDPRFAD